MILTFRSSLVMFISIISIVISLFFGPLVSPPIEPNTDLPFIKRAVLVAIAIPVFTSQLEKSRESTDAANVRSAYAEVVTHYLDQASVITIDVSAKQKVSGWQTSPAPMITAQGGGAQSQYSFTAKTSGSYAVTIDVDTSTGTATPSIS